MLQCSQEYGHHAGANHDESKFVGSEESAGGHDLLSFAKLLEELVNGEAEGDQRGAGPYPRHQSPLISKTGAFDGHLRWGIHRANSNRFRHRFTSSKILSRTLEPHISIAGRCDLPGLESVSRGQ